MPEKIQRTMTLLHPGLQCYQTLPTRWSIPCKHSKSNHTTHSPRWEAIYDPPEIERLVLRQHQIHFSQANRIIFTIDPLQSLINDKCTIPFAQQVLQGTADIDSLPIDIHTKMLLKHLKKKINPNKNPAHNIDPEVIIQGFKQWPECTSTSPSSWHLGSWHLGIYKSLAKHFPPKIPKCPLLQHPQPYSKQQWYTQAYDPHDGSSHYPYPHLWLMLHHMDTPSRKRTWQSSNWLPLNNTSLQSRLQPPPQVDFLPRIHTQKQKSPTNHQQLRRWLSQAKHHRPGTRKNLVLQNCWNPLLAGNYSGQWCYSLLWSNDWISE